MGTQPPSPKRGWSPQIFGLRILWSNGCMDQECRPPQFSAHFYRGQTTKRGRSPQFSAHVYCSQTAGWIQGHREWESMVPKIPGGNSREFLRFSKISFFSGFWWFHITQLCTTTMCTINHHSTCMVSKQLQILTRKSNYKVLQSKTYSFEHSWPTITQNEWLNILYNT